MRQKRFIDSLRFALQGIVFCFRSEPNMKFHALAAFLVSMAAWRLDLSAMELLVLFLTVALVLITEMINTALEKLVDLVSPGYHPLAKIVKDVAAGAVLLAALTSLVVGYCLFLRKLFL